MFSHFRRAVTARTVSAVRSTTTQTQRRFGSGHNEHHVDYMSTKSELPPGDWRDKPMHWDFKRTPESPFEQFVASHLSGPDDPALKLTKGQFIVHMRRLGREEFGYEMFQTRMTAASFFLGFIYITNSHWNARDVNQFTNAEQQYLSMFDIPRIYGENFTPTNFFRLRMNDFFRDQDESVLDKLPQDIKDVYFKYKDQYNDEHGSADELFVVNEHLSPQYVNEARKSIKTTYNLSDDDLLAIFSTCSLVKLAEEMSGGLEEDDPIMESAKHADFVSDMYHGRRALLKDDDSEEARLFEQFFAQVLQEEPETMKQLNRLVGELDSV